MGLPSQPAPARGPASQEDLDQFTSYLGSGDYASAAKLGRDRQFSDADIAKYAGSTGKVSEADALSYLGQHPATQSQPIQYTPPPQTFNPAPVQNGPQPDRSQGSQLPGLAIGAGASPYFGKNGSQISKADLDTFNAYMKDYKSNGHQGYLNNAIAVGSQYGFTPDELLQFYDAQKLPEYDTSSAPSGGAQFLQGFQPTKPAVNSAGATLQADKGSQQYKDIMAFVQQNAQTPTAVQVDPRSTVAYQLQQATGQDSPLMQQAKLQADLGSAQRGLLDSSYSEGARQAAMVNAAMPMAQQDAQTYNAQSGLNQNANNQFQLTGYQKALDTTSASYLANTDYLNRAALNTSFTNDSIQQANAANVNSKDLATTQAALAQQTNALNTYNQYLSANKLQDSTQAFEAWKTQQDNQTQLAVQNIQDSGALQRQILTNNTTLQTTKMNNDSQLAVQTLTNEYKKTGDTQTYNMQMANIATNIGTNITNRISEISRDPNINTNPVSKFATIASSIATGVSQLNQINKALNPNFVPETIWKYMGIDNNPDLIGQILSSTYIASSINGDLIKLPSPDKIVNK